MHALQQGVFRVWQCDGKLPVDARPICQGLQNPPAPCAAEHGCARTCLCTLSAIRTFRPTQPRVLPMQRSTHSERTTGERSWVGKLNHVLVNSKLMSANNCNRISVITCCSVRSFLRVVLINENLQVNRKTTVTMNTTNKLTWHVVCGRRLAERQPTLPSGETAGCSESKEPGTCVFSCILGISHIEFPTECRPCLQGTESRRMFLRDICDDLCPAGAQDLPVQTMPSSNNWRKKSAELCPNKSGKQKLPRKSTAVEVGAASSKCLQFCLQWSFEISMHASRPHVNPRLLPTTRPANHPFHVSVSVFTRERVQVHATRGSGPVNRKDGRIRVARAVTVWIAPLRSFVVASRKQRTNAQITDRPPTRAVRKQPTNQTDHQDHHHRCGASVWLVWCVPPITTYVDKRLLVAVGWLVGSPFKVADCE